jgi:nitroreductase
MFENKPLIYIFIMSDILESLNWRYATKKFDAAKKITQENWDAIEQALVLSPSSYGLQPWKFIVVNNPEKRKELQVVSWNQSQVIDASHFVVFASKKSIDEKYVDDWMQTVATTRNIEVSNLAGYKQMLMDKIVNNKNPDSTLGILSEWTTRQTYLALGNVMTAAAALKIDTCAIEGIDSVSAYNKILGVPESEWQILCACAFGYRSNEDKYASTKKVRFPKERIIQYI